LLFVLHSAPGENREHFFIFKAIPKS